MEELAALRGAGLTETEARVYLALLRGGELPLGEVAKRGESYRRNAYDALKSLGAKGLVSAMRVNGRAMYSPSPPSRLVSILRERGDAVEQAMPGMRPRPDTAIRVECFTSFNGIKAVLNDVLETGEDYCLLGGSGTTSARISRFMAGFHRRRIRKRIRARCVYRQQAKQRAESLKKMRLMDVRLLPKNYGLGNVIYRIYGKKLAMVVPGESPTAVLIENEAVASSFRAYFDYIWARSRPL